MSQKSLARLACVVAVTLGISCGFLLRAQQSNSIDGSEEFVSDITGPLTGRAVGEPSIGRDLKGPTSEDGRVLAYATGDVSNLAGAIDQSSALDNAAQVRVDELRKASSNSRDVCAGVQRPTANEDIIDTRAFRIVEADAVVDVRISEFDEPATVDRVLQASRSAWEACDGKAGAGGGTVERSVLSFVSLSGTPGVNLQSSLLDDSGALESSSQTLAIPAGDVLIEVRLISNGELSTSVDPVKILNDVESLL